MGMNGTNVGQGSDVLTRIIGARLSSVDFVLDYLILGFDGKGALTTLVWPEIYDGATVIRFGTNGYRDRLCELITQVVRAVEMTEDETMFIKFANNSGIRIPLRDRKIP